MSHKSKQTIQTAIFVISLETSTERRAAFEAHARASSRVPIWSYFQAHRHLQGNLIYNADHAIVAKGRELYPSELGVYSSHYAVWQKFLAGDADQILVLEDDVVIDWDFVAEIIELDLTHIGLKFLKLFNKNITPFRTVSEHFYRRTLIDCYGFPHGLQAYFMTRAGAEAFSSWCRVVRRPLDDEMDRSWAHGVPILAVFPFPAFERYVPSTIGTARYEPHRVPLAYQQRRIALRLNEKLRRAKQRFGGYGRQKIIQIRDWNPL